MTNELPKRKNIRLAAFDYGQTGYYYVTVCTKDKRCMLGSCVGAGLAPPEPVLTQAGQLVLQELLDLPRRYSNVQIDKYVVMPNHVHAVIILRAGGASPAPTPGITLPAIISTFKSMTTRQYNQLVETSGAALWQRGYYDHIIRNEEDYLRIWQYIDDNPAKWAEDEYYTE